MELYSPNLQAAALLIFLPRTFSGLSAINFNHILNRNSVLRLQRSEQSHALPRVVSDFGTAEALKATDVALLGTTPYLVYMSNELLSAFILQLAEGTL